MGSARARSKLQRSREGMQASQERSALSTRRGLALEPATRTAMEETFAFDFGNVRVHADASAAELSDQLGANAMTIGSELFFAEGRYAPETEEGQHLLAHELTHVVQNALSSPVTLPFLSDRDSAAEAEAQSVADRAVAGEVVAPAVAPGAAVALEGDGEPHHHKGGWMDHLFGLNPDKSFVESGMEGLGYGQDGVFGRPIAEGESQWTTLGRGLGAAAVSPLAGIAAIGGHALDEINHGPSLLHGAFDW